MLIKMVKKWYSYYVASIVFIFGSLLSSISFFFLNEPPPPEFSSLSLHDALPITKPICHDLFGLKIPRRSSPHRRAQIKRLAHGPGTADARVRRYRDGSSE